VRFEHAAHLAVARPVVFGRQHFRVSR
jgi:hypothetical protein